MVGRPAQRLDPGVAAVTQPPQQVAVSDVGGPMGPEQQQHDARLPVAHLPEHGARHRTTDELAVDLVTVGTEGAHETGEAPTGRDQLPGVLRAHLGDHRPGGQAAGARDLVHQVGAAGSVVVQQHGDCTTAERRHARQDLVELGRAGMVLDEEEDVVHGAHPRGEWPHPSPLGSPPPGASAPAQTRPTA